MGRPIEAPIAAAQPFPRPTSCNYAAVLACICCLSANNYFAYHAPSAVASLYERDYLLSTAQFGGLFTVYSAPNVFLVFLAGVWIDRYGLKITSLAFNTLMLIGVTICALTPFPRDSTVFSPGLSFASLLFGRLLLGFGESLCAAASAMLSRWFAPIGHLNFAMSVNQAMVQLMGSSAAFFLLPRLNSLYSAQWLTVTVCVFSLLANIAYVAMETRYQAFLSVQQEEAANDSGSGESERLLGDLPVYDSLSSGDVALAQVSINGEEISSSSSSSPASYRSILLGFSPLFWLLLLHVSLVSPILYTFTAYGPLYLQENFSSLNSPEAAGAATSLLYLAILAAPLLGYFIDSIGHRAAIQSLAALLIPMLFLILHSDVWNPRVCLFMLGLAFSVTESNSLAMLALAVPEKNQGAAYGLLGCCISAALFVEPALVGELRERTGSFHSSIWVFIVLSLAGALTAIILWWKDSSGEGKLSGLKRERKQQGIN